MESVHWPTIAIVIGYISLYRYLPAHCKRKEMAPNKAFVFGTFVTGIFWVVFTALTEAAKYFDYLDLPAIKLEFSLEVIALIIIPILGGVGCMHAVDGTNDETFKDFFN